MEIDFVIPWVDGSDSKLIKKRNSYSEETTELNGAERYRDTNLLEYLVLSIKKYASWVHHVYIVTDSQIPTWFKNEKGITIIDHTEFIPEKYLPTFNSNAILMNIHRIPNLTEHFVLFNDDMIINDYVKPTDFFSKEGLPSDCAIYSVIPSDDVFSHIILNDMIVLNRHFKKKESFMSSWKKFLNFRYGKLLLRTILSFPWNGITGFYNPHVAVSYLKSSFEVFWEIEQEVCEKTSKNKFRTNDDVSDWVVRYFQLQSGKFEPRSYKFGKYYLQNDTKDVIADLKMKRHKIICINDVKESNLTADLPPIINALNQKF